MSAILREQLRALARRAFGERASVGHAHQALGGWYVRACADGYVYHTTVIEGHGLTLQEAYADLYGQLARRARHNEEQRP